MGLQRPPDPELYCTLPPAALVWDTGAPILREKSPPLKFCIRPPTLVIRHCVQGGSETSNAIRAGDGGTDEKTGGGAGGGRDVKMLVRSDQNGQDQE